MTKKITVYDLKINSSVLDITLWSGLIEQSKKNIEKIIHFSNNQKMCEGKSKFQNRKHAFLVFEDVFAMLGEEYLASCHKKMKLQFDWELSKAPFSG